MVQYDVWNRRTASIYDTNGDSTTDRIERYAWDGKNVMLDFIDPDGSNGGGSSAQLSLATRYVWGQAVDQLLAQETVATGNPSDVRYAVTDNLGSIRSLVDYTGTKTDTFSYDTYGNVTVLAGSLDHSRYLFTCQEYDFRTASYYYDARWYDPRTGRFESVDPTGIAAGDPNFYRYVGNGPTNAMDPLGLLVTPPTTTTEDSLDFSRWGSFWHTKYWYHFVGSDTVTYSYRPTNRWIPVDNCGLPQTTVDVAVMEHKSTSTTTGFNVGGKLGAAIKGGILAEISGGYTSSTTETVTTGTTATWHFPIPADRDCLIGVKELIATHHIVGVLLVEYKEWSWFPERSSDDIVWIREMRNVDFSVVEVVSSVPYLAKSEKCPAAGRIQ